MPRPLVEVLGPWLPNKGDVLNVWAVRNRLSAGADVGASTALGMERLPPEHRLQRIKWPPDWSEVWHTARSGSLRTAAVMCRNGAAVTLVPGRLLRMAGVAAGPEVSLLVDCSGYGYGDVWSAERTHARADYYRRLRQQGARIVLLPQAFGPFTRPEVRAAARRVFGQCDRMYARDAESVAHVRELDGRAPVRGPVPDITHLVPGRPPADRERWARRVCIVPNLRMYDQTPPGTAEHYERFLQRSIVVIRQLGLEPCVLVHESHDMGLARRIAGAGGDPVPVMDGDALTTKGLIGACHAVIGSRYHALVSALAQGVPAIGTSWSHKYEGLFADYGCAHMLFSLDRDLDDLATAMRAALDPAERSRLAAYLAPRAAQHRERVAEMWTEVEALLTSAPAGDLATAPAWRRAS